ncbi:hypothetical protein KDA00_02340 [Candidatus Saccharibacteria bacterium]|nr:hypothetical protein [Candidatus Saccharibacteria bacterium]
MPNRYPTEETLGENCMFWYLEGPQIGCCIPKAELMGRLSCEGMIDDVCLFVKDGRKAPSLSHEQMVDIKIGAYSYTGNNLPPGEVA